MNSFEKWESNVRSYCRSFPEVFQGAKNAYLYSESGKRYLDFFAGAGTLNYGHNNEFIKKRVLAYLESDNVLHALDMHTTAKRTFIEDFAHGVLTPRELTYKLQFCAPTGADAVEAALKVARRAKGRPNICAFSGGFHGMTLGALSATANRESRAAAGVPLSHVTFLPYASDDSPGMNSIKYIEKLLRDGHSGVEKPAAIIFETVQAEGGINVAPVEWLVKLREICDAYDVVLICDDIQVGCYRTGTFFSFERAGIVPDIVLLSKSLSGLGLPMSLVLMKPELDIWKPGEHTGTFRGNQTAFVGATAAIEFARTIEIESLVRRHEVFLHGFLNKEIASLDEKIEVRGIGMIWGVDVSGFGKGELSKKIATTCFERGLIIERAGRNDSVVKLIPPLTIEPSALEEGCQILKKAISDCF